MAATNPVDKIKLWVFPTLVSIIGIFIWQEIKEIKSDVKALLAQSNIDKTRIDNLERELYGDKTQASHTGELPDNKRMPMPVQFMLGEFLPAKNELDEEESI